MTVTTTANSIQYAGNGATTAFAFPYIFFAPTDLQVTLVDDATTTDVTPPPVLNGVATYDYTVIGVVTHGEYASGGTVTFNTAPITGYTVSLVRAVPAIQAVTLVDNSKFPANTINTEFDYLTVLAQQTKYLVDIGPIGGPFLPLSGGTLTGPLLGTFGGFSSVVQTPAVEGGVTTPGNAGTLRSYNNSHLVAFHWEEAIGRLHYRIDNGAVQEAICSAINARYLNLVAGGGPMAVSLNVQDLAAGLYGIFIDAVSDAAVKHDIVDSPIDAMAMLDRIRVRQFEYNDGVPGADNCSHVPVGLVAQEVAAVIPEAVVRFEQDGLHRINSKHLIPYLLRAVQQLQERIVELEEKRAGGASSV